MRGGGLGRVALASAHPLRRAGTTVAAAYRSKSDRRSLDLLAESMRMASGYSRSLFFSRKPSTEYVTSPA